mmetsp:Transcript_49360/g.106910  ORF Transcript_49360/g.106910 Transcript_49360/m.106910 type:complete len:340 (-) Transcript_49360:1257-2276(-)
MHFRSKSGADFFLDGLVVECILLNLKADDLHSVSITCRSLRFPAQAAAHRALLLLAESLSCTLLRHCERGSWISQLREWEAVRQANLVWLNGDEKAVVLVKQGDQQFVKCCVDQSGNGNSASMYMRMPAYKPDTINGLGVLEFDGASVLKTRPFAEPIPQPITLMVVARARGDTTIVDSLGPNSSRFELCHGYPSGWHPSPEICMTASGHDASPKHSLRGSTRGTGDWHIYTAIFDQRRSEVFVDGFCEASGKNVGNNSLDGLSIGCDHNGIFFLIGSLAELRLYKCHIPPQQRIQLEASLARRYGLPYSATREVPVAPKTGGRFACAFRQTRVSGETY